jgi:predicted RNA-binding Zn ribbon-like protein
MQLTDFRFYLGSLSMNFSATSRRKAGDEIERIPTLRDFDRWLDAAGLVAGASSASRDQYRAALELREAIYRIGRSVIDGRAPARADIDLLNATAAHASSNVRLDPKTLALLCTARSPVDAALSQIAADAIRVFGTPEQRARLHKCDGCEQIMLSQSRGKARRWCSMQVCGNRAKVAAFRERMKT